MAESYEALRQKQAEEEEKPMRELLTFCKEHTISSDDLMVAYQIALGIPVSEAQEGEQPIREELFTLAQMIDTYTSDGYPLNKIADMIEGRAEYEEMPKHFEAVVDGLDVSDNEKKLLKAVMKKEREGTLFIYKKGQDSEIVNFSITEATQKEDYTSNDFASELMMVLKGALHIAGDEGIEIVLEN